MTDLTEKSLEGVCAFCDSSPRGYAVVTVANLASACEKHAEAARILRDAEAYKSKPGGFRCAYDGATGKVIWDGGNE